MEYNIVIRKNGKFMQKKWEIYAENISFVEHYKKAVRHRELLRKIKYFIDRTDKEIILDLGCGEGIQLLTLRNKDKYIIGIDISKSFLQRFKRNSTNLSQNNNYIQADITHIPLKNSSIELCINSQVMEHIKDDNKLLQEIKRIIKPKSIVIITVPIKQNLRDIIYIPFFKLILKKQWFGTDLTHLRLYSTKGLLKKMKMLDFSMPY